MKAAVAGIGAWYPDHVRKNSDWPSSFGANGRAAGDRTFNDIPQAVDDAARVTTKYLQLEDSDPFLGAVERRFADESISAVDAEVLAAQRALCDAQLRAEEIDVVISYSVVPDRITPASACSVAHRLGARHARAWSMDAACATALSQIAVAQALVESGQARHVLLTQSHLLLRAFPMLHPAAPGLGDAATAVVVSHHGRWPILRCWSVTHGEFAPAVTWVRGAEPQQDTPWFKAGAELRVGSIDKQQAKTLQRDTVSFGVSTLRELCACAGVDVERIGLLASVEPRGWVSGAIAEVSGLAPEVASSVYRTRGHLGACGPIANLEAGYRHLRTNTGGLIAMYAQGAGFTRAGVLLQMDDGASTR